MNISGSTSPRRTALCPTLLVGIVAVAMAGESTGVARLRSPVAGSAGAAVREVSQHATGGVSPGVKITVTQDARASIGAENVIITATWCGLMGGGVESSISVRVDVVGVLARLTAMIPWARPGVGTSRQTVARRRRRQRNIDPVRRGGDRVGPARSPQRPATLRRRPPLAPFARAAAALARLRARPATCASALECGFRTGRAMLRARRLSARLECSRP